MLPYDCRLQFPSAPCYLQIVRQVISEMSRRAGLSDKTTRLVTLAVDEACANIIRHTYHNEFDRVIVLRCRIMEGGIEFCLEDDGDPVDLDRIKHRDPTEVRPGGLGTFFMKNIMNQIEYTHLKPKGNQIRMVKFLHPEESAE